MKAPALSSSLCIAGAHTYERVDQPRGEFCHTHWTGTGGRGASSTYAGQESEVRSRNSE